jgi:hypothetical protein
LLFHSLRQLSRSKLPFGAVLNLTGLVGCAGFLVHSFVDFNVHLPANLLLFFMVSTLATSTLGNSRQEATLSTKDRSRQGKR